MAEAEEYPSLGGYDDEFVSAVDEDWICPICDFPLKDAVQTGECGHRFCRQCLEGYFLRLEHENKPLSCPVDRNILTRERDMFLDKATNRKILSFIIKCPSEGCQWTGELRSKEEHLESCSLKVVSCTNENCHVKLTRGEMQEHVTTTCEWRILRCSYCFASHAACNTKLHQGKCKRFPLNCPESCGAVIAREEISSHIEKDCPLTMISCPHAEMGCATKVQRSEVELHLESALRIHFDLACVKFNETQVQLNKTKEELQDTKDQLKHTMVRFHRTEYKFEETTRKLEEKIHTLQDKLMQCRLPEDYTWKISGFSEVLRQAKSGEKTKIFSTPFFYNSYKFRLSVDPNGQGPVKDTHLSVFFALMKGEKDAILLWPFHNKITFMLIDQQEHPINRKNIVMSFITDPVGENFARPLIPENRGRGFFKFVSHTELRERRYLLDDTIFIQVRVSPP